MKIIGAAVLAVVGLAIVLNWSRVTGALSELTRQRNSAKRNEPLVELVADRPSTIRLTRDESADLLGLKFAAAQLAPPPEPLRLPGSLFLDPNRLIHVHSRFGGESVSIGEFKDEQGHSRPLQYGDKVKKGQVLAVIWSKDVGEKKSELVDAISKLEVSQTLLKRLESLEKGVVAERTIFEARRAVEADLIAVSRAERTLRSWRISDEEIDGVHREVKLIQQRKSGGDLEFERKWAETEVRAAIDGVIVEKNFNVGDIVDPQDDLFKIADLGRLLVMANVYEEDLWRLRALEPQERRWSIDLKSDPSDNHIDGVFELIGSVIDPAQRTGVVMGWLDNKEGKLAVGQFITATVPLPRDPSGVSIPESALIEEGDSAYVFVETDASRREFSRRRVEVVRRSAGVVYVSSKPRQEGAEALSANERVVVSGSLGLGGELANLVAAVNGPG